MNKTMKLWAVVLITLAVLSAVLSGCNAGMDTRNPDRNNAQQRMDITGQNLNANDNAAPGRNIIPGNPNNNNNMTGLNTDNNNRNNAGMNNRLGNNQVNPAPNAQQLMDNNAGRQNDTARAENIKRQLEAMREIDNVSVLVNGSNCIVGYTAADGNADANVLRNTIADKVKQIDRRITSVTVTDSPDMRLRINRLGDDMMRNMRTDEIEDRFGRLFNDINNSIR